MADIITYFFLTLASAIVSLLLFAMLLRSLFSIFFDPTGEGAITNFLYALTEPIVLPMRALCAKMHWFEGTPIDMPFMLTYFALMLIDLFLLPI